MNNLEKILSSNFKILIYGDLIIDVYNNAITKRISSECSIPVFEKITGDKMFLGGAGNVLNNLLVFNKNTQILSIIEDKYLNLIPEENIIRIIDTDYKNIIKSRYFSVNQQLFRIDTRNDYLMSDNIVDIFKKTIKEIIHNFDIIVISDYNTGVVNKEIVNFLINETNKSNIPTIIDPKNSYVMYKNCKIIKVNKNDAEKFSNIPINTINDAYNASEYFIKELNIHECIITLSEKGAIYANANNKRIYIDCKINKHSEILDVTGAGDTFISTYALGYLNNLSVGDNIKMCNLFCADVITRKFVSTVDIVTIL